ncbi:dual specificity protein phosphatase family protein [uncultured Roseovarius sp.]|uniref:protein-tyrosine phosphatase family protein n=1 Tax=uncultured Roseovarius sp. TaxID=293344 RepID=UPI00260C8632|nr:dual specificity protein phosphatase family protein [uncultured Roseovarius sp.]
MQGFVIYALPVGRGTLALAPLPGAGGDYDGDMAHIRDWKPAMVISLTTPAEMLDAGAGSMAADVQDAGTRWVSLPIKDLDVPAYDQIEAWEKASMTARGALAGGGRVLIHCRAGCGRSGMVALRLMIEAGENPAEALRRLRQIRPCAVETEAQLGWARRVRG